MSGSSSGVRRSTRGEHTSSPSRSGSYWCHTCQRHVSTRLVRETSEVECAVCGNSFVEQIEAGEPHPSQYASVNAQERIQQENDRLGGLGLSDFVQQLFHTIDSRDPMAFLIQHGNLAPGIVGFGGELASNPGDYHFGSGAALDALLNQLMHSDNSRGAPPASKAFVDSLPKVLLSHQDDQKQNDCAVCKDLLQAGVEYIQLPCKHLFCGDCIKPWLKEHNTCPVCRYELPTDDPEYERARKARRTETSSNSTNSQSN